MKNLIEITVSNKKEYKEYVRILINTGFEQIGTRLLEDDRSYVRINIQK